MNYTEFLGSMSIPMIASYLHPCFKKLSFVGEDVKDLIKEVVREELAKIKQSAPEESFSLQECNDELSLKKVCI